MERPYEFVPLYALAYIISEYERLVNAGFFVYQTELFKMKQEIEIRFNKVEQDNQISIDEYLRNRKK